MNFEDEGIVLSARPHGESGVVLEMMTRSHGRHLGMVRGGRSRTKQPLIQIGNSLHLNWNARLEEHLGTFTIEPIQLRTDRFLSNRAALCGLNYLSTLIRLLPERDPHEPLYLSLEVIIDALHDIHIAAPLLVRFELLMLQELGFGLDLSSCALSGKTYDLAFVSPKTGRAVASFAAGEWASRLLPLPAFCAGPAALPSTQCLTEGFALTHYFMNKNIYEPRGLLPPDSRAQYISLL